MEITSKLEKRASDIAAETKDLPESAPELNMAIEEGIKTTAEVQKVEQKSLGPGLANLTTFTVGFLDSESVQHCD